MDTCNQKILNWIAQYLVAYNYIDAYNEVKRHITETPDDIKLLTSAKLFEYAVTNSVKAHEILGVDLIDSLRKAVPNSWSKEGWSEFFSPS